MLPNSMNQDERAPTVSIVMPVFNSMEYLQESFDALLSQTYKNFECIVVDDSSTDGSFDFVKEKSRLHKNIRLFRSSRKGAGGARNVGIEKASGKYVCFLDSDDLFSSDLIGRLVAAAESEDADLAACEYRDTLGNYYALKTSADRSQLLDMDNPNVWNKLFVAKRIRDWNLRFMETRTCNDVFFTYAYMAGARKISVVKEPLLVYRRSREKADKEKNRLRGHCSVNVVEAFERLRQHLEGIGQFEELRSGFERRFARAMLHELRHCSLQDGLRMLCALLEHFGLPQSARLMADMGIAAGEKYLKTL